ncbi:hypothetical protein [Treponema sp. J25]|uniref:hypothetical protein n=1 Tax=Treponema sp. J25 TaxID=2094121 RepID=UPI00104F1E41|nr:hypothetical protein [Treponema sp. J25]TCW60984.1 hypothetical protein C5O22_08580 [Treponema sp. J25]
MNKTGSGSLSSIEKSLTLLEELSSLGIDYTRIKDLWSRINEELAEAKAASEDLAVLKSRIALMEGNHQEVPIQDQVDLAKAHQVLERELGDLLFAIIDVCRLLQVHPCTALEAANKRIERSLDYVRTYCSKEGLFPALLDPKTLEKLWQEGQRITYLKHKAPPSPEGEKVIPFSADIR